MSASPRLPIELIEHILGLASQYEHVQPTVLHKQSDSSQTIINCIRLCKSTYRSVQKLLFQKCLFFDDSERLRAFVDALDTETPWGLTLLEKRELSQSMFLAPFKEDDLTDSRTIQTLDLLFGALRSRLRRLIINMPLRSLYPDDEGAIYYRPQLRAAFMHLEAIEEFTSINDELYLDTTEAHDETDVWLKWKSLRRLCLYNPVIDNRFWSAQYRPHGLDRLVFVRPDYDDANVLKDLRRAMPPHVHTLIVNTRRGHERDFARSEDLHLSAGILRAAGTDSDNRPVAQIRALDVDSLGLDLRLPHTLLAHPKTDEDILLSQWAVQKAALTGELWEWEGEPVGRLVPEAIASGDD